MVLFPSSPCLKPRSGEPVRISGQNLPRKTRGVGLPYGENFIILNNHFLVIYPCDWRTDRRTGDST